MFPAFVDVPHRGRVGRADRRVRAPPAVLRHARVAGNVHYGLGYTGNGVGPAISAAGSWRTGSSGRPTRCSHLPLVDLEPKRFPPEPVRSPGVLVANTAIRRKDDAEDAGEEPNPFIDFVAKLPRRLGYNLGP